VNGNKYREKKSLKRKVNGLFTVNQYLG